jgi:glycosyltransferase involved in cell wall biosynthesis
MHICHINLAKGFHGGERQTLNLIRELKVLGIEQTLICHPKGTLKQDVEALGIKTLAVSHWLKGHARRSPGDLMHCHCGRGVHWAALQHKLYQQPYIITRRVDNSIKTNVWAKSAYQNARLLVCVSRAVVSEVHKLNSQIKAVVIPDSFSGFEVDQVRVAEIRARYAGKFLIGQAGKLLEHKGFRYTVAAAGKLKLLHPEAHFLILGDGPLREELAASTQGKDNVSMLGHKDDIGNYLAALDLFVFPSVTEGLGSTILEAMQLDIPVLATRAGGIPDLIESGVNGRLVEPADVDTLAAAMSELIDSPQKRNAYTSAARKGLQRYSPEHIATEYVDVYSILSIK